MNLLIYWSRGSNLVQLVVVVVVVVVVRCVYVCVCVILGKKSKIYIYIFFNFFFQMSQMNMVAALRRFIRPCLPFFDFGRPIENRWPMFLSPLVSYLVGWLVSLSHEVAKMSNKLFLLEHMSEDILNLYHSKYFYLFFQSFFYNNFFKGSMHRLSPFFRAHAQYLLVQHSACEFFIIIQTHNGFIFTPKL